MVYWKDKEGVYRLIDKYAGDAQEVAEAKAAIENWETKYIMVTLNMVGSSFGNIAINGDSKDYSKMYICIRKMKAKYPKGYN